MNFICVPFSVCCYEIVEVVPLVPHGAVLRCVAHGGCDALEFVHLVDEGCICYVGFVKALFTFDDCNDFAFFELVFHEEFAWFFVDDYRAIWVPVWKFDT